jgi:hypothetical protein
MISVNVGEQNRIDLLGLIAGGIEIGNQQATAGAQQLPRSRIDEDQAGAGIDQVCVDREIDWLHFMVRRVFRDSDIGLAKDLVHVPRRIAVRQGRNLERSEHPSIETRCLTVLFRD